MLLASPGCLPEKPGRGGIMRVNAGWMLGALLVCAAQQVSAEIATFEMRGIVGPLQAGALYEQFVQDTGLTSINDDPFVATFSVNLSTQPVCYAGGCGYTFDQPTDLMTIQLGAFQESFPS